MFVKQCWYDIMLSILRLFSTRRWNNFVCLLGLPVLSENCVLRIVYGVFSHMWLQPCVIGKVIKYLLKTKLNSQGGQFRVPTWPLFRCSYLQHGRCDVMQKHYWVFLAEICLSRIGSWDYVANVWRCGVSRNVCSKMHVEYFLSRFTYQVVRSESWDLLSRDACR